jgi:hypothetical protein
MPDHNHGIINNKDDEIVGAQHAEPLQQMRTQPLGTVIGYFHLGFESNGK